MRNRPSAAPPAVLESPAAEPAGGPLPEDDGQQNLGKRTKRALGWSFLNNIVGRVGSSLTAIILARILVPEDYGVYAVALVVFNALLSVNELGVSLAIVRWPGKVDRIAPTVVSLSLGFSALLYAGCFLAAPAICAALNAPDAIGVLRLLAAGVLIDAATAVPAALMVREFMQGRRLIVDSVGFAVVSGVSIGLAVSGAGAWSLAWGAILGNIANGVLILLWAPARHWPGFRRDVARELLAFGLPLAAASVLFFAMLNLDYIVVGHWLGPVQLGFYLLAFNLSAWPVNLFSAPVRRVSLAAFSRLQEDPRRAGDGFVRASALLLAAALPASFLLSAFAVQLVGFVYGDKWLPAAQALPFLAALAVVRVFSELAYDYFVALGRSRINLAIQGLWFGSLAVALPVGSQLDGIRGVAIGHAGIAVLVIIPTYLVMLRRVGVPAGQIVARCARPALGLVLGGLVAAAVLAFVPGRFAELAVGGTAVMVAYLAVVHPMRHLASSPA
ncbi:MAG TPA: lipopolysaccharide biosynthesis protein [Mycobacteriales bacterium]|nr:lipopolysaccharide biosynthesis protein [Mycobacteriales bacterium]